MFFHDTEPTEIYTYCPPLSLLDSLPIIALTFASITACGFWAVAAVSRWCQPRVRPGKSLLRSSPNGGGGPSAGWWRGTCGSNAVDEARAPDRKSTRLNSSH